MVLHKGYSYKLIGPHELQGKMILEVLFTDRYMILITSGTICVEDKDYPDKIVTLEDMDKELEEALTACGIDINKLI